MLNSLIGLGAFPIAAALAREDVETRDDKGQPKWKPGNKCRNRLILSIILVNLVPFIYFALAFHVVGTFFGKLPSTDLTTTQIFCIGLLSLSVFAFYRFFLGLIVWKPCGSSLFYTPHEFERINERRAIHPSSWRHCLAGFLYLIIPWLVVLLFRTINLLPN